ncbi:MAG: HAD family hydrolase [Lachnospiraceae bacterium]|jgi:Cof subfamily protein (haloacid dehalogenase superfamily)
MVIFLDIDGTLTDMRGVIPDSALQALKGAQDKGNRLIISSGRSMCEIYPYMRESGLFSGYIAGAGAYVELDGKVLRDRPMPSGLCVRVMEWLQENDADFICECNDFMYEYRNSINNLIDGAVARLGEGKRQKIEANYARIVRQFCTRHFSHEEAVRFAQVHKVNKILYYHSKSTVEEMKQGMPGCRVLPSSFLKGESGVGEISEEGITKADGVKLIREALGLPESQTMAFGDGSNDVEMMSAVGFSVAMGNANEDVKEMADYVTTDYDKDGIRNAFRRFGLC